MLQRRQHDARDLPRTDHEHLAVVVQVAGEEDDDADLRQLGRLKAERPELDAEVGLVRLVADPRQPRQQQQRDPGEGDQVAVALEHLVVAQEDDRQRERDQPDHEPVRLVAREALVEPEQHHDAERGEQRDQREQERVGVGQARADHEVGREAEARGSRGRRRR